MNRFNKIFIAFIFMLQAGMQTLQGQASDAYVKIAIENNPQIKAAFNQYYAALKQIPQAKTLPNPEIAFRVWARPMETPVGYQNAGIVLSQAFPWFGLLKSQGNVAEEYARARFESLQDLKNKLVYDVREAYYELYALEATIKITSENIRLLKSFRDLANVRLSSAKGNAVDLLRAEMELEEFNNNLLYLEDSRQPIQARFRKLLNTNDLPVLLLPDTLQTEALTVSAETVMDSIRINNPSLKTLDHEIKSLEAQTRVAQMMGLPSFNLGVDYTIMTRFPGANSTDNRSGVFVPQVGISLPLYRNKYKAMVKERQFEQTSRVEQKTNRVNELNTMLETTWRDYRNAERRLTLYQRLTGFATQALNVLVAQYASAGKDFEEILRMNRQLLGYELELEKARADQNTNVSYINYLTAKPY